MKNKVKHRAIKLPIPSRGENRRLRVSPTPWSAVRGLTFNELINLMLAHDKKLAKEEREEKRRSKLRKKKAKHMEKQMIDSNNVIRRWSL